MEERKKALEQGLPICCQLVLYWHQWMITSFRETRMRSQIGTTRPMTLVMVVLHLVTFLPILKEFIFKDKEDLLTHTHYLITVSVKLRGRPSLSYRKHLSLLVRPSVFSLVKSLVNLLASQPTVPPSLLYLRRTGFCLPLGTKSFFLWELAVGFVTANGKIWMSLQSYVHRGNWRIQTSKEAQLNPGQPKKSSVGLYVQS